MNSENATPLVDAGGSQFPAMQRKCKYCQAILDSDHVTLDPDGPCPSCGTKDFFDDNTPNHSSDAKRSISHFNLLGEIGRGGFGVVWRAQDTKLDRIVAIKIPHRTRMEQRARQMILREVMAAASLEHPNIVRLHHTLEDDDQIYIITEYIDGDTLKMCLSDQPFSHREAAGFLATTAMALDYAHERGIIHRDVKPANILVDRDRQPHVTDFGVAKRESSDYTVTAPGMLMGTPAYMSPEQTFGDGKLVDRQSDVFSLGVVLYEMLTGQRPFQGAGDVLLGQIRGDDPKPLRLIDKNIPKELETICLKALSKKKSDRYATAKAMAEDLRRFLAGMMIVARPVSVVTRGRQWARKNLALGAMTLVALCSTVAMLAPRPDSRPASFPLPMHIGMPVVPIKVDFTTKPAGAELAAFPRDEATGEPVYERAVYSKEQTPCSLDLLPGDYLVVAKLADGRFHEVLRHVPRNAKGMQEIFRHRRWFVVAPGRVKVTTIEIPEKINLGEMGYFEGNPEFAVGLEGSGEIPRHTRSIATFYLDPHEVTVGEFKAVHNGRFRGNVQPPEPRVSDKVPITGTFYDYCVEYAELIGKRLPTEFEFEYAATNGGNTHFPWGNEYIELPRDLIPVDEESFDRTNTDPPVYGLASNGAEYTDSPFPAYPRQGHEPALSLLPTPFTFVTIRGGPINDAIEDWPEFEKKGARSRSMFPRVPELRLARRIGFRCARSKSPRWKSGTSAARTQLITVR